MDHNPLYRFKGTPRHLTVAAAIMCLAGLGTGSPRTASAAPPGTNIDYSTKGYWDGMVRWHNDATGIHRSRESPRATSRPPR